MRITLTVTDGPHKGREFSFEEHQNFIVGRSKKAQFRLPKDDAYFSRNHFLVEVNPPLCRLLDMGSRNGTYVNSLKVTSAELKDGDVIRGGQTVLTVSISMTETMADDQHVLNVEQESDQSPLTPGSGTQTLDEALIGADASAPLASGAALAPRSSDHRTGGLTPPRSPLANWSPPRSPKSLETFPSAESGVVSALAARLSPYDIARLLPADYQSLIQQRPQPLPGYFIVDELGRGAMGVVYRALCQADHSVVAIKTISPAMRGTQKDYLKFLREADILKSLDHPHIVRCRDVGEANGVVYFAMDYVPGLDASQLLHITKSPLPIARAVRLTVQMLKGLEEAHARGFVHRDIKPSNLLVEDLPNGEEFARLSDFGLARTYQASRLSGLTMTGAIGGTTPYMAPEQITNFRESKPAVDQYSAAASLYHLLTRRHIYEFPKSLSAQLAMILQDAPLPIAQHRSDVPAGLAAAIHRGLAREPEDRFPSVREFRLALQPFEGSTD